MDEIELLRKLDSLSAWRKKELAQAQFLAENSKNNEAKRYLCRAWVLMMYAHCDNFLKEASRAYLEYLKSNIDAMTNYKYELMWLVIRGKDSLVKANEKNYKSLESYYKSNKDMHFEESLINEVMRNGSFKYNLLRYFCDWILQINFNHLDIRDFCETLKNKRDCIAHGEESYIEVTEDCLPWHKKTIWFIDSLKDALIESARNNLSQPIKD